MYMNFAGITKKTNCRYALHSAASQHKPWKIAPCWTDTSCNVDRCPILLWAFSTPNCSTVLLAWFPPLKFSGGTFSYWGYWHCLWEREGAPWIEWEGITIYRGGEWSVPSRSVNSSSFINLNHEWASLIVSEIRIWGLLCTWIFWLLP